MISNYEDEFNKHLRCVKEKEDHVAFAFALEGMRENKENSIKFNEFRKSVIYKKILLKALKHFRKIVQEEEKNIVKYGYGASEHYIDKDFHKANKKRLKLLEEEAKNLT
ncbi:hypothetical protein HYV89_03720 [Candidatus Woesearchaeota archaeon]|nr:hypothetical protein [Candidatus Woesearchaeota archaeon]